MTIRRADDSLRYRPFGRRHIDRLPWLENLSRDQVLALKAVAAVLPFRVNRYVLDELIDWNNIPSDPIYQLVFPQVGMLARNDFNRMLKLVVNGVAEEEVARRARAIQMEMNPHPSGQLELNVPRVDGEPIPGCQHKYRALLSSARPDLPRLLHLLFQMGAVRRGRQAAFRRTRSRHPGAVPHRASRGFGRALHRR